jgi:hypothetical protein
MKKYQEVMTFIETNHHYPSRHNLEERGFHLNWLKQNRKLFNVGKMKEEMVTLFLKLLELGEKNKHVNQYY